ncbi:MAG: DUF393 domain-containing protein [Polyangiaceae bacterium]
MENAVGQFEVFFDGECPLCAREIAMLARWDRAGRIRFTDIASPAFDARSVGVEHSTLMGRIHGRMPTGELVTGVEVFRQLYGRVGFGVFVRLSRVAGVRHVLDALYGWFARNRLRLTGRRCEEGRCAV